MADPVDWAPALAAVEAKIVRLQRVADGIRELMADELTASARTPVVHVDRRRVAGMWPSTGGANG